MGKISRYFDILFSSQEILPSFISNTTSATFMVDFLCDTRTTVFSSADSLRDLRMMPSFRESRFEVGSSIRRNGLSWRNARAIPIRCFSPPERRESSLSLYCVTFVTSIAGFFFPCSIPVPEFALPDIPSLSSVCSSVLSYLKSCITSDAACCHGILACIRCIFEGCLYSVDSFFQLCVCCAESGLCCPLQIPVLPMLLQAVLPSCRMTHVTINSFFSFCSSFSSSPPRVAVTLR